MLEWLWPSVCLGCDRQGEGWLCPACTPGRACVHTRDVPEGVARVVSISTYDGPLGRLVRRGKYTPDRWIVDQAGALLADRAAPLVRTGVIVPAPSSWRSRLGRGFSTGAVLARRVARVTGLPVRDVLRLKPGRRQATQNRDDRRANLAGRMRCDTDLRGPVWLVDDVVTTGATAEAAARELLASGASEVSLLVVCRVESDP